MSFLQVRLPVREGLAAWAAAASTAGAILPGRVLEVLDGDQWTSGGHTPETEIDEVWDAFSILEAVAAAARSVYENSDSDYPMPRGMEVRIEPTGSVSLLWRSDTHVITLQFGGGWARPYEGGGHWAPNLEFTTLFVEGESLDDSPRVAAAVAASPTLQEQGWM